MERADGREALRDRRAGATLAEDAEVGPQVGPRRASPVRAPRAPASRGRNRRRSRRRAGCAARRRARRGSGGTARGRDRSSGRPPPRSRVGGRLDRASAFGRRAAARTVAPPRGRPPPFAPPPARGPPRARAGRARASGFGGPPAYLTPGTMSAAGVSLVEPQMRQIAASSLRASGPSSVSCRPPSGSWFVVKSQRG